MSGKATLTIHCTSSNVIAMYQMVHAFMRLNEGQTLRIPKIDTETGQGFITIDIRRLLNRDCSLDNRMQIIQVLRTRPSEGEPTKEDWCKSLVSLGIASGADLLVIPDSNKADWSYDVISGQFYDRKGNVFYETGQEG